MKLSFGIKFGNIFDLFNDPRFSYKLFAANYQTSSRLPFFVNMICNLFFHLDQREICLKKKSIPRCQNQPRADQMKTSTWQLRRHKFNRSPEKRRVLCVGLFCNMMGFFVQKENRMIGSLNVPLAIMPLSLPPALILNSDPRFNTVSCHHTASLHY